MRWVLFFCPRPSRTNSTLPTRPVSALRNRKVAHRPEVADSVHTRNCPQKTADINGIRYSPDTPHYGSGPVHTIVARLSMFELRETGEWDLFLDPPERARAETGGADQWVLKRWEFPGFAIVNEITPASLGYTILVFNKNTTLKRAQENQSRQSWSEA